MVGVTRAFVHDLDDKKLEEIINKVKDKFGNVKVAKSNVVPNFYYVEIEGDVVAELNRLIEQSDLLDYKVTYVDV